MEQSDLVFQKLKAKEREYHDLEDEYLKQKATFTNQRNELYERRDRLARIVEDEASKLDAFLQKGQRSYQEGEQFYRSLQQLMEDSQFVTALNYAKVRQNSCLCYTIR